MSTALHPLARHHLGDAQALSTALNWPHRPEDWELLFTLGEGFAVESQDGALVGTGMWWPHGDGHATIGMVIVAPAHQGRGIGGRILSALLAATAPRALMLNATAAGRPLYTRLGFTPKEDIHQYQGIWTGTAEPATAIRRATPADLPILMALDAAAIGAPRHNSIAALLAAGEIALLEIALPGHRTTPAGFAAARRFGHGTLIGPVIAPDPAAAMALIANLAVPGTFIRIDIPATATGLAQFLLGQGMAHVDTATVMTTGLWQPAPPPSRYALIAQALG